MSVLWETDILKELNAPSETDALLFSSVAAPKRNERTSDPWKSLVFVYSELLLESLPAPHVIVNSSRLLFRCFTSFLLLPNPESRHRLRNPFLLSSPRLTTHSSLREILLLLTLSSPFFLRCPSWVFRSCFPAAPPHFSLPHLAIT